MHYFLLQEPQRVFYHEWSEMAETQALYREVGEKKSSLAHGVFDLAVEQPQLLRKLH